MKAPSLILKILTISSSLTLVGGCVSYRAGLFKDAVNPPAPKSASDAKVPEPIIFGGTKSPGYLNVVKPE